MHRVSGPDAAFLYGERPEWHFHVSALILLDPADQFVSVDAGRITGVDDASDAADAPASEPAELALSGSPRSAPAGTSSATRSIARATIPASFRLSAPA